MEDNLTTIGTIVEQAVDTNSVAVVSGDSLSLQTQNVEPELMQHSTQQSAQQSTQQETSATEQAAPEWWIDDGIPGRDSKPDYLMEKYGYNMAKQAKGCKEAQKLLGTIKAAPEDYDFGEQEIDKDNQYIKDLISVAKENKIQQDAFSKIINNFIEYDKSRQPSVDDELKKLGTDGKQKISTIVNWAKNNLTQEASSALEKLPVNAEVIKMLDEVRQKSIGNLNLSKIPQDTQTNNDIRETKEDIEADLLKDYTRYNIDSKLRASYRERFNKLEQQK